MSNAPLKPGSKMKEVFETLKTVASEMLGISTGE
jgi:hypothetical protein